MTDVNARTTVGGYLLSREERLATTFRQLAARDASRTSVRSPRVARPRLRAVARMVERTLHDAFGGQAGMTFAPHAWAATHALIPPLRAAASTADAQDLIEGASSGVRSALTELRRADALTFQSLWPIVEFLEETGVAVAGDPVLRRTFVASFAALAADSAPAVRCAVAWCANELPQRGLAAARLTHALAAGLVTADTSDAVRCTFAGIARASRRRQWLRRMSEEKRTVSGALLEDSLKALGRAAVRELSDHLRAPRRSAAEDTSPLVSRAFRQLLALFDSRQPLAAITAVAAVRDVLCKLREDIAALPKPRRERFLCAVPAAFTDVLRQPGGVFLTVEALETLRDAFPAWTAQDAAQTFATASSEMRQGIVVSVVEWYEEQFAGRLQNRVPQFEQSATGVRFKRATPTPFDTFCDEAARCATQDVALWPHLAWANERLHFWQRK